jgi:hypothetical protein
VPACIATDCAGALETRVSGRHTPLRPASARVGRLPVAYSDRGRLNVQSDTSMGDGGLGNPAIIYSMGTAHAVQ